MLREEFKNQKPVSEILKELCSKKEMEDSWTLGEIVQEFRENGFILLIFFFALPVALPLPYPPGFTMIFGIPLTIVVYQMLRGYSNVRLPQWLNQKEISYKTLNMITTKAYPSLKRVERYLKPRIKFVSSIYFEKFIGLIILTGSIFLSMPVPFTHIIPAIGICVMALGMLKKDGLVILVGIFISLVGQIIATITTLATLAVILMLIKKITF